MNIKKRFIKFLKDEGVFELYKSNFSTCNFYKNFRPIRDRRLYFDHAFLWLTTPEKHLFWFNMNLKWSVYLDKIEKPYLFHSRCYDCGRFVKKELWVPKNHSWKNHALCDNCLSGYDEVY